MALGVSAGTWVLGGAVLGSALIGANAASSAADKQVGAANNATAMQKAMFDQTQGNLSPYMQQGTTALNTLSGDLSSGRLGGSFTGADYLDNQDPGYQFQLQQGQQALQNSQAAQDGIMGGAALKGLINFNQGTAATGYQNAYQRWLTSQQNRYGQLSGLATLGENAGANVGSTGAGYAQGMANTITGAGNASAAGMIGTGNAITGALNNGMGYYQLSQLTGGGGGSPANLGYDPYSMGINGTGTSLPTAGGL